MAQDILNIDLSSEVIKAIQILINKAMENVGGDYICYVSNPKDVNNYYVVINEQRYLATNISGQTLSPNDKVLVHCINGNFNNKVIIGKY